MATLKEFIKVIKNRQAATDKYKEYLEVCKSEDMTWWEASKTTMNYLHSGEKLTAEDYKDINKLRKWYEECDDCGDER